MTESNDMYSVDDENQLPVEDTLDDRGVEDALDEGYSPPEHYRGATAFGVTHQEEAAGETLDQRIAQEVPDPWARPYEPDSDDDPDAVREEDEFLDDGEVGAERAGRLLAPDEGVGVHTRLDRELVGDDVGIDGGAASAEEAAVHIVHDL